MATSLYRLTSQATRPAKAGLGRRYAAPVLSTLCIAERLMKYDGYKTKDEILVKIDEAFPYSEKPDSNYLLIYNDSGLSCRFLRQNLSRYMHAIIPIEGIRSITDELANFTSAGMAWVMPNLIRAVLYCNDRNDSLSDCIICDLESVGDSENPVKSRYSDFTTEQLECLCWLLEYLAEQHGHVISSALKAIDRLMHNNSSHSAN